jgi:hypothetical protein
MLIVGAIVALNPMAQTASAIYTATSWGAKGLSKKARSAACLSGDLMGIHNGCTDGNISGGWVDISSQDMYDE